MIFGFLNLVSISVLLTAPTWSNAEIFDKVSSLPLDEQGNLCLQYLSNICQKQDLKI